MQDTAIYIDLSDNPSVQERRHQLKNYTADGYSMGDVFKYIPLYPAGMATGTLEDFRKFGMAFMRTEDTPLFSNIETLREMLTPTKYYPDTDIGLNFHGFWSDMNAVQTLGHGGNTMGGSSTLTLDPINKIGLVVMTNQGNETVYNRDMKTLIFGEFDESPYIELLPEVTPGLYEWTRTIKEDPFKIFSLMGFRPTSASDFTNFWQLSEDDRGTRVVQTHWNIHQVPTLSAILILFLPVSFVIGVTYALIRLLLNLSNLFRRNKPKRNRTVATLQTVTTLLIVGVLMNLVLVAMILQTMNFEPASTLYTHYIIFAVLTALLIAVVLALTISTVTMSTYRRKWKPAVTIYFGIITIIFLVYYNLYAFWMI